MTIGVDIDDVVYRTSEMAITLGPPWLKNNAKMYKGVVNKDAYSFSNMFDIFPCDEQQLVNNALRFYDKTWLAVEALSALAAYKKESAYSVSYCIVTARNDSTTAIRDLLADTCLADVPIYTNIMFKGTFCKQHDIHILLDDYYKNIQSCHRVGLPSIMVSPDYVHHNKKYLPLPEGFCTALLDWNQFPEVLNSTIAKFHLGV